jgi:malate dehydrogenase (oxaloacetate-decarboxylating)
VTAQLEDRPVPAPVPPRTDAAADRDADPAFALHRGGKVEVVSSVPLETREDLSLAYTPGVARVCSAIAEDRSLVYDYTWKSHTVAVVTDGTAVLGSATSGPRRRCR